MIATGHRHHRAEGPVAGLEELRLDEVPDHDLLPAAEEVGDDEVPEARDEDEDRARDDARERERDEDAPERDERARVEVGGRLAHRGAEALDRGVDRQHHERQVGVDETDDDREVVVEERRRSDARGAEQAVHEARGVEEHHPRVRADQEARPERDDDEDQSEGPSRTAPGREKVGERVREEEGAERPADRQREGRHDDRDVEGVDELSVGREGEVRDEAPGLPSLARADDDRRDERDDEHGDVPGRRGECEEADETGGARPGTSRVLGRHVTMGRTASGRAVRPT